MNKIYGTLLAFIFFYNGLAQHHTVKWYTSQEEYLPQNSIRSIVKDKYNFLWITTENGLVRFDGNQFLTYNINSLHIENRLTVIEGSIAKDSMFTFYNDDYAIALIHGRDVKIYNDGTKIKALRRLYKYFPQNRLKADKNMGYPTDGFYSKSTYNFDLNDGSLFTLKRTELKYYNKSGRLVQKFHYNHDDLNRFFIYQENLYYLFNEKVVHRFNKNGTIEALSTGFDAKGKAYSFMRNLMHQQFFIAVDNQLFSFGNTNGEGLFLPLYKGSEVSKFDISSIYHDPGNRKLYIGTATNGLCVIKLNYIRLLKSQPEGMAQMHYALIKRGHHVISAAGGSIFSADHYIKSFNRTYDWDLRSMVMTNHGKLLIQNEGKIFSYDPDHNYREQFYFDVGVRFFHLLKHGIGNRVWFTLRPDLNYSPKFGYFTYNSAGPIQSYFFVFKTAVNAVHEIGNDKLLLGCTDGAYLFDLRTRKAVSLYKAINIRTICKTTGNRYWLTTYGQGLYLYQNGKVNKLPYDNPALSTPHRVLEDSKGFYWVSTNNGLFQFKKKNLLCYLSDNKTPIYYFGYDENDGIDNPEFNGACEPGAVMFDSGDAFFPSMDGIVSFNTNTIVPVLPNKAIYVDRAIVDGQKARLVNDTLSLEKAFENVVMNVDCPDYSIPMNRKIEYAINDNLNWVEVPDNKTITITNLESGYNTVNLRTLNDFSGLYYHKKVIIYIKPPFWETTWFMIVWIGFFFMLIYGIVKIRVSYIEKENRMLQAKVSDRTAHLDEAIQELNATKEDLVYQVNNQKKLIQSITHDIKSPLRFLTNGCQYLYNSIRDPEINDAAKSIYESSFQLSNYIDNLLNYSKITLFKTEGRIEIIDIHSLFEEKKSLFHNMANINKTEVINLSAVGTRVVTNKIFLSIIIHNLIDNAVKHTKNGRIILKAEEENGTTVLSIIDNGNGMTEEEIARLNDNEANVDSDQDKGVGYVIISELVNRIGAQLIIESQQEKGTTVSVILKSMIL